MRTGLTYFIEQDVINESSSFHKSFEKIMESTTEDIPLLQSATIRSNDFFKVFASSQSFLNHHLTCEFIQQLSHSLSDDEQHELKPLVEKVNQYSKRIKLFKKQAQVAYMHIPLEKYFKAQPDKTIKVMIMLASVWKTCSMWSVEQLLKLTFSSAHFNTFQWFRVDVSSESVSLVLLAPKHIKASLIEEVNSLKRSDFMSLTGIIDLQVEENDEFRDRKCTHDAFNFKDAMIQAKTIDSNNNYSDEVVHLLQQIEKEPLNTREISQMDENGNFIRNINSKSTPLIIACCDDNTKMVKLLLQNNADPNVQNDRGFTALMYVSMYGNVRTFRALLDYGADIKKSCLLGSNVLFAACRTGNMEIIKLLLEGKSDVVRVLLEEPGLVNIQRNDGMTPLIYLSCHYHPQKTPLNMASCYHRRQIVELLLKAKAEVDIKDKYGLTSLGRASHNGCIKMVEMLLEAKADPNVCDIHGKTPLCLASDQGRLEIVKRLLEAKADPNLANKDGITPLFIASKHGYRQIVECLLQGQANPNIMDNGGSTPLDIAIKEDNSGIVKLLLQAGAIPPNQLIQNLL